MDRIKTAPQESQAHIDRVPCKRLIVCGGPVFSSGARGFSPEPCIDVVSQLEDHQVVTVNDLFILLKAGDFLDVGRLEPLDTCQNL